MLSHRKVLVLNKSWRAIGIITLEKAMAKILAINEDGSPKVKIIDATNNFILYSWQEWSLQIPDDQELKIRTVNSCFRVPEIIQYTRFDKVPSLKAHFNRKSLYRRDKNTCQYCGEKKVNDELSLDHVIPKCQGGMTNWENIVVACIDCNSQKAGRTPKQAGMRLLREPKRPISNLYLDESHMSWSPFLSSDI
jgi:5-methylcytosine-specific restriction endonuclease McrA